MASSSDKAPTLEEFTKNYESGDHPISFAGISKIKNYYPKLTKNTVEKYLSQIDTHSKFADTKPVKCYNPTFVYETRTNIQADLLQMSSYAKHNKNVNFILICIDSFSRRVWAEPITRKSMDQVAEALNTIFTAMKLKKRSIMCTDFGTEFLNVKVRKVAQEHMVTLIQSETEKCPLVERVIYSIKRIIFKYMDAKETKTYIDVLPNLINVYVSACKAVELAGLRNE